MGGPRYFVDHETIHDRVTGKHVELEEAADILSAEPEAVLRIAWGVVVKLGAALRNMEAERDALRSTALTPAEVEALRHLLKDLTDWPEVRSHFANNHRAALAVLGRLLKGNE